MIMFWICVVPSYSWKILASLEEGEKRMKQRRDCQRGLLTSEIGAMRGRMDRCDTGKVTKNERKVSLRNTGNGKEPTMRTYVKLLNGVFGVESRSSKDLCASEVSLVVSVARRSPQPSNALLDEPEPPSWRSRPPSLRRAPLPWKRGMCFVLPSP